jgi:hypothetical protein
VPSRSSTGPTILQTAVTRGARPNHRRAPAPTRPAAWPVVALRGGRPLPKQDTKLNDVRALSMKHLGEHVEFVPGAVRPMHRVDV